MAQKRPRKHRGVGHLPSRRRLAIYFIGLGVWLSGGLWLIFHYFVKVTDEFGFENISPFEHWWLVIHALFAFFAIWMFGVLWVGHIKVGWHAKAQRWTGGSLFGVFTLLTLTGFGLYYIGNADIRSWTSLVHWIVGLAALAVFLLHNPSPLSRFFKRR